MHGNYARKLQIFSLDSEESDDGQVTITGTNMAGVVVGNCDCQSFRHCRVAPERAGAED